MPGYPRSPVPKAESVSIVTATWPGSPSSPRCAAIRRRDGGEGDGSGQPQLRVASLAGDDAGHAPVTGHRPHAAGEHDHAARRCDRHDIDHDPGEQQPDADQEPERRHEKSSALIADSEHQLVSGDVAISAIDRFPCRPKLRGQLLHSGRIIEALDPRTCKHPYWDAP